MTDEQMANEHTSDEQTVEDAWREVGRQFKTLGESLATAFRAAWGNEENRQHLESVKTGLESMVGHIDQAIREASTTPEAQRVRSEMEKAAQSARSAGAQALQDAQPYLLSALHQVNAEIQKVISRLEQKDPD
jgi:vacuolar-type H+-ATPase subunit E/Vma4